MVRGNRFRTPAQGVGYVDNNIARLASKEAGNAASGVSRQHGNDGSCIGKARGRESPRHRSTAPQADDASILR